MRELTGPHLRSNEQRLLGINQMELEAKNEKSQKGISRIDSKSTHGWFVRAYRNGKTYSKLFSDRKHGGRDKAYEAAKAFHENLRERLKAVPKETKPQRVVVSDSRNKTGEIGVSRTSRKGPKGAVYECFSVSWRPKPGVQKCTSFSIKKYGEKKAFRLAVEHRRKMMKLVHGESFYRRLSHLRKDRNSA